MKGWYRSADEIPRGIQHPVVALGFFDGIHAGHQAILRQVQQKAAESGGTSVVLTLDQHPSVVVGGKRRPKLLTTLEERVQLLFGTGVDVVVTVRFDSQFAALRPEQFVRDLLVERLGAKEVVAGYDYRFGWGGSGDVSLLRQLGLRWWFHVTVVDPVVREGRVVSSTVIRQLVRAGEVEKAAHLLTRAYFLRGQVVRGDGRGRQLGFPTANLEVDPEKLLPADGVYAVWARFQHRPNARNPAATAGSTVYPGVLSVSEKPTFGGSSRTVEAHLLNFAGDVYGCVMEVGFVRYLRSIYRFANPEELVGQVQRDVEETKRILALYPGVEVTGTDRVW